MRTHLLITLIAAAALDSVRAQILNFTGPYDVNNWTTTAPIGGSIDTSSAPGSVSVIGPDQGIGGYIDFTITAVATGTVSFDWNYTSPDDPFADKADWLLNGSSTYIFGNTTTTGSGTVSFTAQQGDSFGFRLESSDGCCGAGQLTVSNFSAVPEPRTYGLIAGLSLFGFAILRRVKGARPSIS